MNDNFWGFERDEFNDRNSDIETGIDVKNAGLMLPAIFYPMLYHKLGLFTDDRKDFKDTESRIRAIFLLQYVVYGEQREWLEADLFLNKLLVGMEDSKESLPRRLELKWEETDLADNMLDAILHQWDKMRNTSPQGFRNAFLQRNGKVIWHADKKSWEVKVEQRAYDVLIDSLPWGYQMLKSPWSKHMITTTWR